MIFEIKKVHEGYILVRKGTDKHSHFKHRSGALITIQYINKKIIPNNNYFWVAIQRLLTDDELLEFKKPKQRYNNRCAYAHN